MKRSNVLINILLIALYLIIASVVILLVGVAVGGPLVLIEVRNIHMLLTALGIPNVLMGTTIYLPRQGVSFQITWQCSGMFSMSLYTILYLTFPRVRKNVFRLVFGLSVIYIVNLLRIAIAIYLYDTFGEDVFSIFHYTIGPIILFLVVVLLLGDLIYRQLTGQGEETKTI